MDEEKNNNGDKSSKQLGKSRIFTTKSLLITIIGALLGGLIFGLMGYFAENGSLAIPRLEPLFAAPYGSVTIFLIIFGASLGSLIASLASTDQLHRDNGAEDSGTELNMNKWFSWGIAVLTAAIILSAVGYIWFLSAAY